jgi:hypothetical protein
VISWYLLWSFGTFFPFWYVAPRKTGNPDPGGNFTSEIAVAEPAPKLSLKRRKKGSAKLVLQGCQIFLGSKYQNGEKYQMTTPYTKWP